jgi:hypothetical protein
VNLKAIGVSHLAIKKNGWLRYRPKEMSRAE